ncbi:MAG TPA: hypothetical protein VN201_07090 [Roseateles sp.]|nr:hypothetical protein [Roseateles sp.]
MTESVFYILGAFGFVSVVLLLVLLLRKPKFETPADLSARLGLLEQASQALVQAVSRNEGGMQRIESPRVSRRLNTLRGLSHEQVEQVLARGA